MSSIFTIGFNVGKQKKGGTASATAEMKRAADDQLESRREKSAKDGLVNQLETYQNERANAISQGDALKELKFSALVAEVKLQIARRALDDPLLNDEAKARALDAEREAKVAQRQAEYDRRKAKHDLEVAELKRDIAKAEAKIDNVSLSESRRNAAEADWVESRKRLNDLKWDEAAERAATVELYPEPTLTQIPQALGPQTFEEFEALLAQFPVEPETNVYGPPGKQRELLGVFHKDGDENRWPVLRRGNAYRIDLELEPSLVGELRPAAQKLLELLKSADPKHFLLLAVSGGGKTSAFADLARSQYVLYVQCAPYVSDTRPNELQRRSRMYDHGYAAMLASVRGAMGKEFERNVDAAKRLFAIELVIRLAQLYVLVKSKSDVTPFEYYVHQRNVGDEWLEKVRRRLQQLTLDQCTEYFGEMRGRLKPHFKEANLIIAIDELEAAASEGLRDFDPDFEKRKGFLSPIVLAITALETGGKFRAVFAGTGTSVKRTKTIESSLNKDEDLQVVTSIPEIFPTITREACLRFFSKLNVTLDEFPVEAEAFDFDFTLKMAENVQSTCQELLSYFVIGSRYRTLTRILNEIIGAAGVKNDPSQAQLVLRQAIMTSVSSLARDLGLHISKVITDRDLQGKLKDDFMGTLTQIWTAMSLNGGRAHIISSHAGEDLMALGIGNFSGSQNGGYYEITEYVVVEALRLFLEANTDGAARSQFRLALASLERVVQVHGNVPARGTILEQVVFAALLQDAFKNNVISTLPFVAPFANQRLDARRSLRLRARSPTTLSDPWWTRTLFIAEHVRYHHDLEGITTSAFLASDQACNVVYSPESVARFDGVLKFDATHALSIGMTIWSGPVPTEKVQSQIRSTDLTKAYFRTDGMQVNSKCQAQREEWTALGLDRIRCVRVHLALPTFTKYAELGVPIGGDELGVHLDQSNCHLLFGRGDDQDALYEVLAIATNTSLSSWPGHRSNPEPRA